MPKIWEMGYFGAQNQLYLSFLLIYLLLTELKWLYWIIKENSYYAQNKINMFNVRTRGLFRT